MTREIIRPCAALGDLISHFWTGTWEAGSQPPNTTYYVIAGTLTELTFAFNDHGKHADLMFSAIQGHTHLPRQFEVDGFRHLIGVSFYSHAIPCLFNIPASALNGTFVSLQTFLGHEGAALNEKIAAADNVQQRIQLLSRYFISMLNNRQPEDTLIHHAINTIISAKGNAKIDGLARKYCLSQKQFGRRFKAFSGFSPKTYSRIIRFESVISAYSDTTRLTEAAYESNYYDQPHFIHEFKSLTGFTPRDFWKLSAGSD